MERVKPHFGKTGLGFLGDRSFKRRIVKMSQRYSGMRTGHLRRFEWLTVMNLDLLSASSVSDSRACFVRDLWQIPLNN
jgi:hypothetical protein